MGYYDPNPFGWTPAERKRLEKLFAQVRKSSKKASKVAGELQRRLEKRGW